MAPSPAIRRMQDSAGRILGHYGGTWSFQLYAKTKDWDQGSETEAASGSQIKARCSYDQETVSRSSGEGDRTVRTKETVLHVEIPPFEAVGGLTDEYRFTDDAGTERRIQSAVMNPDDTYYVVKFGTHGR